MDINDLRSIVTLLSLVLFIIICYWAFSKSNRDAFDEIAMAPLREDDECGLPGKEASS
ncbi:MAG: cbb3-type cytochrome c oxidase subunit 3 [Paucibacter sp.]|nr:cbb3-type cytochrome c oxidase subunit 3 [Roseateles sp.]